MDAAVTAAGSGSFFSLPAVAAMEIITDVTMIIPVFGLSFFFSSAADAAIIYLETAAVKQVSLYSVLL